MQHKIGGRLDSDKHHRAADGRNEYVVGPEHGCDENSGKTSREGRGTKLEARVVVVVASNECASR